MEDGRGSTSELPLVTIVLGSYQHARFLTQALEAIAAQTYPNIELVVSDDASTDGSADLIAAWLAEHRPDATFIRHEENVGLTRAINATLEASTGSYLTLASADDWMEPERIERLVEAFEAAPPSVGLVCSGLRFVDVDGRELGVVHDQPGSVPTGWVFPRLLNGPIFGSPTMMVRRSIYDEVGIYNEDDTTDDYDMWLRICRDHELLHVPAVLVNHRLHGGNLSAAVSERSYFDYQARCLRRHLGFSPETDRIIHARLAVLEAGEPPAPDGPAA